MTRPPSQCATSSNSSSALAPRSRQVIWPNAELGRRGGRGGLRDRCPMDVELGGERLRNKGHLASYTGTAARRPQPEPSHFAHGDPTPDEGEVLVRHVSFADVAESYLGIDGSEGMIAAALARGSGAGCTFARQDLEDLELPSRSFELVISRMALHYVDDLHLVFGAVRRALCPGGRFVYSVSHPVITSHDSQTGGPRTNWTVDHYFVRGPRPRPWFGSTVTWHHRTVEDYVRLLLDHGFTSPQLLEGNDQELTRWRRVPLMLLMSATAPI